MAFIPGVGMPELLIVLVVVLLLFGPKRLPQLGKSIGKTVKAIREGVDGKSEAEDEEAVATKAKAKRNDEDEDVAPKAKAERNDEDEDVAPKVKAKRNDEDEE